MKKSLIIGALAALLVAPAVAADLPRKAPVYKAPIAPAFSWNGFYIGANIGFASSRTKITDTDGWWAGSPEHEYINWVFTGGGQIGFNYQTGRVVYGIEADIDWLGKKTHGFDYDCHDEAAPFGTNITPCVNITTGPEWMSTVRGRLGLAFDRALIYGTGGVAFAGFKDSWIPNYVPFEPGTRQWISDGIRVGWVVGGGIEYALMGNWTMKAETLYAQFENKTAILTATGPLTQNFNFGIKSDVVTARVGVNYLLGGGHI